MGDNELRTRDIRPTGELVKWVNDRGFGFIRPHGDGGDGRDVFIHIRELDVDVTPAVGSQVVYEEEFDAARGRVKAVRASILGADRR